MGRLKKDRESLSEAYDAVFGKYQRNAGNAFGDVGEKGTKGEGYMGEKGG